MCEDSKRKLADMKELDENTIAQKPWAQKLLETVQAKTKKAVLNWCGIVCKIGEADLDLDKYSTIFLNQVENLYEDLIADVDSIEQKTVDKIVTSLEQLQTQCRQLRIDIPNFTYEEVPLGEIYKNICQKIGDYETLLEIRRKEWQDLHQKQMRLCKNLGSDPLIFSEFPSAKEIDELRALVEELETAAMEREEKFFQLKEEIVEIANELGTAPSLDFEREILNLTNSEVRIGDHDMEALAHYHQRLIKQRESVVEEIAELRTKIDSLWNKLETDIAERDAFRQQNVGNSLETLRVLREEVGRLDEIKKANIKAFICKQREQLCELWTKCHTGETERQAFRFYNSDCYNEDLFELHEREIEKWTLYFEENKEMLELLEEYNKQWERHLKLESNNAGDNRYQNRGGVLLREERLRNQLKKRIPQIELELQSRARLYRDCTGREFQTFGVSIAELINTLHEDKEKEFKNKLSAKKMQREQQQPSTTAASRINLFPSTPSASAKRKVMQTPTTEPIKRSRIVGESKAFKSVKPTVNVGRSRRRSARREQMRQRLSFKQPDSDKENVPTDINYKEFEDEVSSNFNCRSTGFSINKVQIKVTPATPNKPPASPMMRNHAI